MDPKLWCAFAGNSVQIHTVGSEVYYFPQGHVEQSTYTPSLSPSVLSNPVTKCLVTAAHFHADSLTDEVCLKLNLHPFKPGGEAPVLRLPASRFGFDDNARDGGDRVVSFAKILTSSDANNGGGFSVPRFCADSIFPPLNYQADPPVQTLSITDVHGVVWNFRHIYRGTPRRHLLTTGWSKFVNHKKLVAGDSVVFAKNSRGEMFIGIRRVTRAIAAGDCGRWHSQIGGVRYGVEENRSGDGGREVFSRSGIGKVPAEAVANAAELAAQFRPFEVVYYPRAGWSEFVVKAETVNKAMKYQWSSGIRVKMAMETEDSSKMTWYQGTVTSISIPDHGPWLGSPWRMLQVTWDETDALQSTKSVSPWEVEFAAPTPPIQPPLHPAKKFRGLQKSGLLTDEEEPFSPMMRFSDSTMDQFNPSLLSFNSFPAGMQGARQNLFCESRLSNSYKEITPPACDENSMCKLNVAPKMQMVSTDLLIGSAPSDTLSPDSQASVLSFATEATENQFCNSSKAGVKSFQLFGQVIYTNPPVENGLDNGVSTNDGDKNPNQSTGSVQTFM